SGLFPAPIVINKRTVGWSEKDYSNWLNRKHHKEIDRVNLPVFHSLMTQDETQMKVFSGFTEDGSNLQPFSYEYPGQSAPKMS
nr:hypothetical protein [Vibrio vulnificus]